MARWSSKKLTCWELSGCSLVLKLCNHHSCTLFYHFTLKEECLRYLRYLIWVFFRNFGLRSATKKKLSKKKMQICVFFSVFIRKNFDHDGTKRFPISWKKQKSGKVKNIFFSQFEKVIFDREFFDTSKKHRFF